MKDELLSLTRRHVAEIVAFQKAVKGARSTRISQVGLKTAGSALARTWFDQVRPALQSTNFSAEVISKFSYLFETLLRLVKAYSAKAAYVRELSQLLTAYEKEIIHEIEIGSYSPSSGLSIAPYIEGLPTTEGDYLDEAQRCLQVGALRGCIVLGWCAAIARIHDKISEIGFSKFNQASVDMAAKTFGRYKPFTKKFAVDSLSELQRIFDTDILWVLEYLELIDSNQHQRLRYCFDLRNNSAHPGLAPITGENLYSFFSDITKIILKNQKFQIEGSKQAGGT